MLLALSNHLDTNWGTVWWFTGSLALVSLVAQLIVVIRRRALRGSYSTSMIGIGSALLVVATWHLFGWETLTTDTGLHIRRHRTLGRTTSLVYDNDKNWFAESKVHFKWSHPWTPARERDYDFRIAVEDRNHDGQWDTWWEPVDEVQDGDRVLLLRADTNLDGKPDVELRDVSSMAVSSYEEIRSRRGF